MAKQLNVSLAFTANTNEAIAAIKRLQKDLNGLATGATLKNSGISQITPEIQRAMVAAGELQAKLESAVNLKTGKLDLGLFTESLRKGKTSIQDYATQLSALGPAGRQAFISLAQSIIQAEAPLVRCSQKLKEFSTTLANTARWQLSSSILHGFMSSVSTANRYVQDLNETLTDIRIVSGKSAEEMASFAEKANQAAKALHTTTNEYARASLIYFQQGDTEAQAMDKASITAKMANVTGQSAEIVSNQLTAIWNNFNKKGNEAYEHFADVLTKLGAETASSTDEIAGGLEKFAGIAEQVGLSYEYAASALATITAVSRESEDVVGTALKTIFARIQGLSLGETLDDGTNLNKYSEALAKVGISIFDQNNQIKEMDTLLDEMASKWKTLNKDQQTALAQTVAGVRQYNQLTTLMNNWDFMERNLTSAYSADGELEKQSEIYGESWKAARDEVTASAEAIYSKLLDDDFFISLLKFTSLAIDRVSDLVDAFGGLPGVLLTVGAFTTRIFHDEMVKGLHNAASTVKQFTGVGQRQQQSQKEQTLSALRSMHSTSGGELGKAENAALEREVQMQHALMQNAKRMTEEELKQVQIQMDLVRSLDKQAIAAAEKVDKEKEALKLLQTQNRLQIRMDNQAERRKIATNKALNIIQNNDNLEIKEKVDEAKGAANRVIRDKYGLSNKGKLPQQYINERNQIFASNLQNDNSTRDIFKTLVNESMDKENADLNKNIATYQKQISLVGELSGQGISLSNFANQNKDINVNDEKQRLSFIEQLKARLGEAKKTAGELYTALEGNEAAQNSIKELSKEIATTEGKLEGAKKDAEDFDKLLKQLNSDNFNENGNSVALGEFINDISTNTSADIGEVAYADVGMFEEEARQQFQQSQKIGISKSAQDVFNKDVEIGMEGFNESANSGKINDWADNVANVTGVIMGLGSAITSVQGAINVFNNPDSSGWDKFFAVLSLATSILPIVTTLMSTFGNTAMSAGTKAGAGMTAALGPIGLIILAVTALTAAFIALSSAIYKASPEGQFKTAEKAAQDAAKAADEVKASYDALNTSLNNLDSGIQTIEELERGTLEWRSAIADSNAALIDLLSTYDMLDAANFTTDADGVMKITDEAKNQLLEEQEKAVNEANNAKYLSQIAKNVAESRMKASQIIGEGIYLEEQSYNGEYTYDRLTKSSHESADIGQEIAKAINSGVLTNLSNVEDISNALGQNLKTFSDEEIDSISKQIASNEDLQKELVKLSGEVAKNTEANRILNNQIIENEFGTQLDSLTENLNEPQQEAVKNLIGKDFQEKTEQIYNSDYKDAWWLFGKPDKDIQKQYAEAMGYDVERTKNLGGNKATYYTKDGTEIPEVSDEVARRYLASQAAAEEIEKELQKYATTIENTVNMVKDISENTGNAMTTFAGGYGGDFSSLTGEEKEALKSQIGDFKDKSFTINGQEIDNEFAKDLGYKDAKAYYDAIQNALDNYDLKAEKLLDGYSKKVKEFFEKGEFEKLSLEAQEKVGNALQKTFNVAGERPAELLTNILKNAGDKAGIVADTINAVDWSKDNAILDLEEALKNQGVTVESLGNNWERYTSSMVNSEKTINKFIKSFDSLREKMNSINSITKELKFGDIISDEDYKTLLSYNKEVSKFFSITADGYKFIGDESELGYSLSIPTSNIGEFKEAFEQARNDYEEIKDTKFTATDDQSRAEELEKMLGYDSIVDYSIYGKDALTEAINFVKKATDEEKTSAAYKDAIEKVNSFRTTTESFFNDAKSGKFSETSAEELWINNNVNNLDELNQAYLDGAISLETLQKMRESVFFTESTSENFAYEDVMSYAEALDNLNSKYEITEDESERLALQLSKMKQGITSLSDSWEEWAEILGGTDVEAKSKVYTDLRNVLSDLTNLDMSNISSDILDENFESFEKAAQGDAEAINKLMYEATLEYASSLGLGHNAWHEVSGVISQTPSIMSGKDLTVGASLDEAGLTEIYNRLLETSQLSVEHITQILSGLGFKAEFDKSGKLDGSRTSYSGGGEFIGASIKDALDAAGSDTSKARKDLSDFLERYKEVNDEIETNNRLMQKNSTIAEGLWGQSRLKKLKDNIELIKEENKLIEKRFQEASEYLIEDKNKLNDEAENLNISFDYDENGNIINYTEMMTQVYEAREKLLDSFGEKINEQEQQRLDEFEEKISNLTDAYKQYEETLDQKQDDEQKYLEGLLKAQTEYYNLLNEELEINLSINDDDLKRIDYYLNKISDDFYQMAEAAAYMVGNSAESSKGQRGNYLDQLGHYKNLHDNLIIDYQNNDINQQQYVEGLRKVRDGVIENLNSLHELDDSMMSYYENTLAMGVEELAEYTTTMEHQTSVLEHYSNVLNILGKQQDYESLGVVLEAQAKTIGNEAKVAQEYHKLMTQQAADRKAEYENALASGMGQEGLELLKKQWDDAEKAVDEAQTSMLEKTEAWAEAIKATIENELSGLAQTLENALTADFGGSFDSLSAMMERKNSLQEEYLTVTNQIYETNKMMRTAQQEIDKSTNSVAKRKLKGFIDETEQLQNQSKLSKYELDIQKAKYDLLLAEIALEEAQNAKSTVRLSRDSEGNFGYVYTADSGAVDAAAQQFEDAENALYNIGLQGANDYTQKYQQTLNEFYDTMTDLQTKFLNGEFENEQEYHHAMESAKEFYYQKLQDYSSLYSVALTTDARVVQDAWSTEFQSMTFNTQQWMTDVDVYVKGVESSFASWESQMTEIKETTVGPSLDDLKTKTQEVVTESNKLASVITTPETGVIAALGKEYDAVTNVTLGYATLRDEIKNTIAEYEKYLNLNLDDEFNKGDEDSGGPPPPPNTSGGNEQDKGNSGSGNSKGNSIGLTNTEFTSKHIKILNRIGSGAWGYDKSTYYSMIDEEISGKDIRDAINWFISEQPGYFIGDNNHLMKHFSVFKKFDTGGYTGDWAGSYGKLALLHKKELILNPDDTENFLTGIDFLNNIVKVIDLYSMNAQLGGLLSSPSYSMQGGSDTLEQQVHIEASFPNVTSSHEIEDALNTLVNRASQYANRK